MILVPLAVTHYQSTASPNANSSRDQHALSYSEPTGPKTSPRTSGISALKGENFLPLNLESTGSEGQEQEKPESEQPAINPDDTSPEDLDIGMYPPPFPFRIPDSVPSPPSLSASRRY